jgi:3-oxoadipate enol-lactonase
MAAAPEQFLDVGSARIAFTDTGKGDKGTIVFSHPLFFDKSIFKHQVAHFSGEYRVVTYDHRGHGNTGKADDNRYDAEALTEDAIRLIESLGVGPVHFAGNSMGGFVALRLAARRPDLLRSAIAISSSGDEEENPQHLIPLNAHLLEHGGKDMEAGILDMMFGVTSMTSEAMASERELWLARIAAHPPLVGEVATGVVFRGGINRSLGRCPVPVLAIAGEEDKVYAVRLSEAIAKAAPLGEWTSIKGAGHVVAAEQPEATNAVLSEFLARVEARSH